MLDRVLGDRTLQILERALDGATLKQRVIADNIANVNTPNFKRADVVFADFLESSLVRGNFGLTRTGSRQPAPAASVPSPAAFRIVTDKRTSMRTDGNNVDIDVEMANLTKNNLYYEAVARQASALLERLRYAINEGRR